MGEPFVFVGTTWLNWHEVWLTVPSICSGSQRRERWLHHSASTQQLPDLSSSIWVWWWGLCVVVDYLYEQNVVKALLPISKMCLSLQAGAGWMPWSWLSAALVSTSWQPKLGGKQISARLQSPPIYSTCCSLLHSVMQSCYSKHLIQLHTQSLSKIIYLHLIFIRCCWWRIYSRPRIM